VLDTVGGATIGLVVETQCHYFAPLSFPQTIEAGIRVAHMGSSSVRYEVGLFAQGCATDGGARAFRACVRGPRHAAPGAAARAAAAGPAAVVSQLNAPIADPASVGRGDREPLFGARLSAHAGCRGR
jgi:hypothetical protein